MNRTDKPKLTSHQIVEMMKNEKGITFLYTDEEDTEKYLVDVNNYSRTNYLQLIFILEIS